ncbi:MAG: hypothetical protein IPG00_20885 [Saprospiraceae bacterium]|nr:hypothetical protein [Saprospiraceae bacterium]
MDTIHIKAHTTDNSQIDAIKAFMKSLKIKFELAKEDQSPYNPELIKKIKQSDEEFASGKGIKMSVEEFKELCK